MFLAGSIEQGAASPWQESAASALADVDVLVFNPRRSTWDPTIEQTIDNPQFAEQVNWELDHLEQVEHAFFYFEPGTKSPITLMELGYLLGRGARPIVVCPSGFWRHGNVEIMCARANPPVVLLDNLADGLAALRQRVDPAAPR